LEKERGYYIQNKQKFIMCALPAPRVRYDVKRKAIVFVGENAVARGLVPSLKKQFYPMYDKKVAKFGPAPDAKEKKAKKEKKGKGKAKSRGMAYGRLVDKQVGKGCITMQRHALDIRMLMSAATSEFKGRPDAKQVIKDVRAFRTRAEPAVRNIFTTMQAMKLHPIATQYGVGSHALRVATFADVVCVPTVVGEEKERVVLEIKSGYTDGAKHTGHAMRAPFTQFNDCPFHQHHLQLAGTVALMNNTLADHIRAGVVNPVTRAYILRASAGMVHVTPLEKTMADNQDAIRMALMRY
jgi:hypothetical protein